MSADQPPYPPPHWPHQGWSSPWASPWAGPDVTRVPWTARFWPAGPEEAGTPAVLTGAVAVGLLAALVFRADAAGSAYLAVGVGILGVAFGSRTRPPAAAELVPAGLAVAAAAVAALRAADWLGSLALAAAWALGSLALAGGRTWSGLAAVPFTAWFVPLRAARWARRALAPARRTPRPPVGVWAGVAAVSTALLLLFGALFASADAAFAELLDRAFPEVDGGTLPWRAFVFALVTAGTVLAAHVAHRPPHLDALAPAPGRPVRRWAWAVPLVLLDLLFAAFVLVQLTVLFGGRGHVPATQGLTYAEYARQGFWQLLAVTALTLGVLAAAVRWGPRATPRDRALVRGLLGPLCLLALVVVASALHRMSLYEDAFGYTRLRLVVTTVEYGLGGILVLVLIAGIRMRGGWLPRGVAYLATLTVLGLAALNPDAYVAEHNVTRYQQTGKIDVAYLSWLSADAVPALQRLPAGLRGCALERIAADLRTSTDPWYDLNLARWKARRLLAASPPGPCRR